MAAKHCTLPAFRATGAADIMNDHSALLKQTSALTPDLYPYLRNIGQHLSRVLELDDTQAGMRVGVALSNHMTPDTRKEFISAAVGADRAELCNVALDHVRTTLNAQRWTDLEKEIALAASANVH